MVWRKKEKELTAADKNCNSFQEMVHLKFGFPVLENNYRKYGMDYTLKDNQKKTVMNRLSGGNSCDGGGTKTVELQGGKKKKRPVK